MAFNPEQFARQWVEAWNRRDVEAVLAHFAEDVTFVSPKAKLFVGRSELRGKAELRAYWERALERITDLHFTLDHVVSDQSAHLAIVYQARLNGVTTRGVELLTFNEQGQAIRGEGFYGAQQG